MQLRRVIENVVLVLLIVVAGGWYLTVHRTPCKDIIQYRVGTVDPGFKIREEELRLAIDEAAAIWERGMGMRLFAYNPKGSLPVSLVYDTRQALTEYGQDIKRRIDEGSEEVEALKKQYFAKRDEYEAMSARGAPYDERKRLADELNSLSVRYNAAVERVNSLIGQFNRTAAGREFEAGFYGRSATGAESIELYEYGSRTELVRLIAHELGHALGLEHNSNPDSIMYHQNRSSSLEASPEDLADVRTLCGIME